MKNTFFFNNQLNSDTCVRLHRTHDILITSENKGFKQNHRSSSGLFFSRPPPGHCIDINCPLDGVIRHTMEACNRSLFLIFILIVLSLCFDLKGFQSARVHINGNKQKKKRCTWLLLHISNVYFSLLKSGSGGQQATSALPFSLPMVLPGQA